MDNHNQKTLLTCRQGSVIADVTILYDALDDQQLIVLQEDLDQDGLLNQDMPVVYTHSQLVVTEGMWIRKVRIFKIL